MTRSDTPARPTAAGDPARDLAPAIAFIDDMYGQDFGLKAVNQNDRHRYRFADTDVLDRVDPLAITNEIRVLRQRELGRLFTAPVVWLVKAVVRWNERYTLRQRLQELPDYMLKDIGIRRDQIDAVVSGSLTRGPSKLETAAAAVSIIGDRASPGKSAHTDAEKPLAA